MLAAAGWAAGLISGIPLHATSGLGPSFQVVISPLVAAVTAVIMTPLVLGTLTALYFEARR